MISPNPAFRYGPARVTIGGVEVQATNVDIVAFEKREHLDAYVRLGEQIDAWNGVAEVPGDAYRRKGES